MILFIISLTLHHTWPERLGERTEEYEWEKKRRVTSLYWLSPFIIYSNSHTRAGGYRDTDAKGEQLHNMTFHR